MTSHVARLYALAAGVLVFFVAWAAIAAHPWQTHKAAARIRGRGAPGREHRLRAEALAVKRVLDRRWATYRAQLAARRQQAAQLAASRAAGRPRRPPRPSRRDAAPADDHEDLVMERRTFHAMGTEVELLLDAPPGAESREAFAAAEPSSSGWRRCSRASARTPSSRRSTARAGSTPGPSSPRSPGSPLEARERTGGLFDPTVHDALVAAGYDRTFDEVDPDGAAGGPPRCGGGVRVRRRPHRARAGRPPRPRRHRQGLRRRPRRRACSSARGPCLVNAGGDIAFHGRPWPVGVETADGRDHARARPRRDRHLGPRPPPLAARRRRGAPPDRPARPARRPAADLLRVTVVANTAVEAEVLAEGALPRRAARPGPRRASSPSDGRTVFTGSLA